MTPDDVARLQRFACDMARSELECMCLHQSPDGGPATLANTWLNTRDEMDDYEAQQIAECIWVLEQHRQLIRHPEKTHLVRHVAHPTKPHLARLKPAAPTTAGDTTNG